MKSWKTDRPYSIVWNISGRCNLSCAHCKDLGHFDTELDLVRTRTVAESLKQWAPFVVVLSGGEPGLARHFPDILDHLLSWVPRIVVASNGHTIFHPDFLPIIHGHENRLAIQLSLDGWNAPSHDAIRGNGSYATLCHAIERIKGQSMPFTMNATLTKAVCGNILAVLENAQTLGATALRFGRFHPQETQQQSLEPSWDDLSTTLETIREFQISGSPMRVHPPRSAKIRGNRSGCDAPMKCTVLPNGDVYDCTFFTHDTFCMGSLIEQSPKALWNEPQAERRRDWFRAMNATCQACPQPDCPGCCPAILRNPMMARHLPKACPLPSLYQG
ncbi:SPASM domain-containing protein [Pseudodesulfovibrio sp. JC047]|uniref:radical SAM/SPASM domain-containing protein n=1 Tax=Pseudodesulfovibrio sp. JC047 TaxID=2683199 RepID=UPI0013D608A7|nr:radical SAM protein [Pseudodesulfovibrio sp. JC047]NDV19477.1 SPASM domain-containing protein [Pseudodesulfovibrio sp. JC047]